MPTIVAFILLPFLFVSNVASAEQKPYIISGFDDVLRQAENTGFFKAALKVLEEDKGFSGMSELYHVIANKEESPKFAVVSAISNWFDQRISQFLAKSHFPSNHRFLRNWLTDWSIESFKIKKIRDVLKEKPDRKFIIILDNSQASLELVDEISQQFSKNVIAIYLRQVQIKKVPPNAIGFYTAFDVAAMEHENGRLSDEDTLKIGQAVLNEQDINFLIPSYAACPSKENRCALYSSAIKEMCLKVSQHLKAGCKH